MTTHSGLVGGLVDGLVDPVAAAVKRWTEWGEGEKSPARLTPPEVEIESQRSFLYFLERTR